jgi:hypothetical protein
MLGMQFGIVGVKGEMDVSKASDASMNFLEVVSAYIHTLGQEATDAIHKPDHK